MQLREMGAGNEAVKLPDGGTAVQSNGVPTTVRAHEAGVLLREQVAKNGLKKDVLANDQINGVC